MSEDNNNIEQKFLINNEWGLGYLPDLGDPRDFSKLTFESPQQLENENQKEIAEIFTNKVDINAVEPNSLPQSFDFSIDMPQVRNQGSIGSCTAFALDGIVSYYNKMIRNKTVPTSTLYSYKKSRDLDNSKGDTGSYLRTVMKCLKMYGWIEEKRYPYITSKYDYTISRDLIDYGTENQAISYVRLDSKQQKLETLVTEIKKFLTKKIPVMLGFSVFSSIEQANTNGGIIPYPSRRDKMEGGHAVVFTGYNDNIIIKNKNDSNAEVKGGFIFRNSWSDRWGNKGYGVLPYKYVEDQIALDFWSLLDLKFLDWGVFD